MLKLGNRGASKLFCRCGQFAVHWASRDSRLCYLQTVVLVECSYLDRSGVSCVGVIELAGLGELPASRITLSSHRGQLVAQDSISLT